MEVRGIQGEDRSTQGAANLGAANLGATINDIPYELLDFILSHLDESNKQETVKVSKLWNERTIKTASEQENAKVGEGIQTLISKIDSKKYSDVIKNLNQLLNENPICHSESLIHLKENLDSVKVVIANELSQLEIPDLNKLKTEISQENIPQILKNIVDVAKVYKKINHLSKEDISTRTRNAQKLSEYVVNLAQMGEINEAIKRAEILSDTEKSLVFAEFSAVFNSKGNTVKADKMLDESYNLMKKSINQAIEDVKSGKETEEYAGEPQIISFVSGINGALINALLARSGGSTKLGHVDQAIELATMTPSRGEKSRILKKLLNYSLATDDLESAKKITELFPYIKDQLSGMKKIVDECEKNNKPEEAQEMRKMLDQTIENHIERAKAEGNFLLLNDIQMLYWNFGQHDKEKEMTNIIDQVIEKKLESIQSEVDLDVKYEMFENLKGHLSSKRYQRVAERENELFPESYLAGKPKKEVQSESDLWDI